ncbi:MAG: SH3 domain-containing protein [Thermoanaerobaculia bacterium]
MKRLVCLSALLGVWLLHPAGGYGAPQLDSSPLPDRQVSARAEPCVRLRTRGSLDGTVLDCLEPGTRLRLLGSISGWSHIRLLDGTEGWLDSGFLEMAPEPPSGLPTSAQPTPPATRPGEQPADELLRQIAALEGQLKALSSRRDATEERLRKTVAVAEAAQTEASRLRKRVQQLESQAGGDCVEPSEPQLAAARARVEKLEADLAGAEQNVTRQASRIAELEAASPDSPRKAELKRQLKKVGSRLRDAEQANAAQAARIEELEAGLAAAELRSAEQAQRAAELTAAVADAERRIAAAALETRLKRRTETAPQPRPDDRIRVRAPIGPPPEPSKISVRMPAAAEVEKPAEAPAEPPVPPTDAAIAAVRAWATAWSDQRVDDYLSFYAAEFQPPNGLGRTAWEAQRRQRLTQPRYIRVTITALTAELAGDGTVRASFGQEYESDTFADRVTKVLTLTGEDGSWRIVAEQATP